VGALAGGCRDAEKVAGDAAAGGVVADATAATATAAPMTTTAAPPRGAGCRIMVSEGGPAATADTTAWLDLPAKASVTVRTLETGRELRFEGPGRIRACGGDVALVAEGSAVGLPGSGEAPGAEQWVATACGVARWASGVHRFGGARDACKLQSSVGTVHLYLATDVTAEEIVDGGPPAVDAGRPPGPWRRIDVRQALRLQARGPLDAPAAVKSALASCERAALDVQSLSARMTQPEGGTNTGELAAESVSARGLARAACAVAAVRVAIGGAKAEDLARLDAASARWRAPR